MGTGTNCSFTNSTTGLFVQLLCSSSTCCDTDTHVCTASACTQSSDDSGVSLNTYLFWVILAGAALFTVLVLLVSYAVCRYRKPGCADAGAARDRFLEENVLAATAGRWQGTRISSASPSTSQGSTSTPSTSSPPTGQSPSSSPDPLLLVHKPLNKPRTVKSMIPVKKPNAAAVNKAFFMGAEAFARKPIAVQRKDEARAAPQPKPQRDNDSSGLGVTSPRMVQLGGFTPRLNFRDKGRTESKQTIISSDTDSMTTVGS